MSPTVQQMATGNCTKDQYLSKTGNCCDRCDAGQSASFSDISSVFHRRTLLKVFVICCLFLVSSPVLPRYSACHLHSSPAPPDIAPSSVSVLISILSGSYMKAECGGGGGAEVTECAGCGRGLYTATKNHLTSCHICRVCSPGKSKGNVHSTA